MGAYNSKSKTITAANQWTDPIQLEIGGFLKINLAAGSFVANIQVQRRNLDGSAWDTITDSSGNPISFSAVGIQPINPYGIPGEYRVGCPTGGFTSVTTGPLSVTIEGQ